MSQCQLSPSGPYDHLSCSDVNAMPSCCHDLSKEYCFVLEEEFTSYSLEAAPLSHHTPTTPKQQVPYSLVTKHHKNCARGLILTDI